MSINHREFSERLHCPRIPVKGIGLKVWAVVIDALEKGEQLILVRKGGLIEETKDFRLEDTSFYLYPIFEQYNEQLIKETYLPQVQQTLKEPPIQLHEVSIRCMAHVTDEIELLDAHALKKVSSYHIFADEYAVQHLHWKKSKPLHFLIIRTYRLSREVSIPVLEQYASYSSWMRLETEIENVDCIPVMEDHEFHNKRMDILSRFGLVDDKK